MIAGGWLVRPMAIWLACLLAWPQDVAGQQRPAGNWSRLSTLPPGASIIVTTKAHASYHGQLIGVTTGSLSLNSDERGFPFGRTKRRRELRREDVQEVRRFSRTGSTLAGAGIGAAVGGGIGLAVDLSSRSNEDRGLATVLFALLGSLFGWGIGRHSTLVKGETIYVAP